ncbi:MAG: acyl carrier protein [Deferribacteraceae bacterium]|nr:acyl carrier protein [Deferribacteraceae bacterium]
MDKELIKQKLTKIFQDIFDDEALALNDSSSPQEIEEWDSLAQVNILVQIEKLFGIKFSIDETRTLKNVGAIVDHIKRKIS